MPEQASFTGEFRSRNLETLDLLRMQVLTTLQQARDRYMDASVDEELKVLFRMYTIDPAGPMVQTVSRVLEGLGLAPQIRPSGGGTDANVFLEHGLECLVVGMATNDMHTTREYVRVDELADTARFCHALLTNT